MTRAELEHAIRAACDIMGVDEIYVFGSQAILGSFPDIDRIMRMSLEVDISHVDPQSTRAEVVEGAIGEDSHFHHTHGFWVHGFPISSVQLPQGWEKRVVRVCNRNTDQKSGLCLEPHDLAASKLPAGREKDRRFVRTLLRHGKIDPRILIERLETMPLGSDEESRLIEWVRRTSEAL